ncbi:MAG: LytTR family transcriptional regulator [Bacteroidales bacterium]|nr:LytTR family transcriptional regulator [Bacteroidales bacterium]
METFKKHNGLTMSANSAINTASRETEILMEAGLPVGYVIDGFFVKQNEMMVKISYSEIVWVEAGGNYSHIHFKDRAHISVVHNIGRVAEMLPKRYFTRINKSEIVNLHYVNKLCGNLIYIEGRSFTVASNYKEYVFSCFNILVRRK